ncbi:alpha/beta fold hydrolase [Kosakonia sp. CCTCC M2018092]|uniref:alpha/beta fold hydrolase n=1 Tax=Kosakonia sp. CCTCC M2018092 TaxID=2492396 RepID=UPI003513D44A
MPDIVLVHGAFTDGSSWSAVMARLQAMGYHVTAVQNPLTSLKDDVNATRAVVARQPGEVLLVGHSWAGAVISEAGNDPRVKGLVYLSALVPDSHESVADLLTRLHAPMTGLSADEQGLIWLDDPALFHKVMANDLSRQRAQLLAAAQQPIAARAFTDTLTHAAWHDKPSWYLVTENDAALNPTVQNALAKAIGATRVSLYSSHLSMISHADRVAEFIDRAARTLP